MSSPGRRGIRAQRHWGDIVPVPLDDSEQIILPPQSIGSTVIRITPTSGWASAEKAA
jgi:hypothetical protein